MKINAGGPVAFSQDGRQISARAEAGHWQICDVHSGHLTPIETENWLGMMFSPTGTDIAGANGNEIRIWNTRSGALRKTLSGHEDNVLVVAYSPDGTQLASASLDRTVRMWDTGSGELLATFPNAAPSTLLAFSPDGIHLIAGDRQTAAGRVWDVSSYDGAVLKHTDSDIRAMAVSPDGIRLAVAVEDGTVQVLHAASGKLLLNCCERGTAALAFSPDGSRLATGDRVGTVRLYDARSGQATGTFPGHSAAISSLAFDSAGTHIVSASSDGTAKVWDASSSRVLATLTLRDPVYSATFGPNGDRILTASGNRQARTTDGKTVQIWDWRSGTRLMQLDRDEDSGTVSVAIATAFSPGGSAITAAFASRGEVSVWDTSTWKRIETASNGDTRVTAIAYSPDGSRFVTRALPSGATRVWDAATYELLLTLNTSQGSQPFTAFSPDGSRLFSASNRSVRVWNTNSSYYPGAAEHVSRLQREFPLAGGLVAHLRADRKLDAGLREAAIKLVQSQGENAEMLNRIAWSVVRTPNQKAEDYRSALWWAEAATKAARWDAPVLNTLGVAQYRNARYRDALVSFQRSEDLRIRPVQSNLIFIAMAHFQLGETESARAELHAAQQLAKSESNPEVQGFIREAEALISSSKK